MRLPIHKRFYPVFALLYLLLVSAIPLQAKDCEAPAITTDKTSICSGETTTLILDPTPSYSIQSYAWFRDDNADGVFEPVTGGTNSSLTVSTAGMYYVVVESAECDNSPLTSNQVQVNVTEKPSTPIISLDPPSDRKSVV